VPIPGATSSTLRLPRVARSDDGSRFRCILANSLGVEVSEEAVLTVRPDQQPPGLEAAFNTSLTSVLVRFTEPVATNTALIAANYSMDGGVTVSDARPGTEPTEV